MWDVTIYDGQNMDLADWLLQIEKEALLTNTKEYELAVLHLLAPHIKC